MTAAGSGCRRGGACPVADRVPHAIREMREMDGRCVGCGRAVVGDARKAVRESVAELDEIAQPKTSAPPRAPVEAATSDGSEPTSGGAESDPLSRVTFAEKVRADLDALTPEAAQAKANAARDTLRRAITRQSDLALLASSEDPAAVALRAKPVAEIVDAIISLTHQIHGCIDGKHDERARALREQRAIAKLEIVRRAS